MYLLAEAVIDTCTNDVRVQVCGMCEYISREIDRVRGHWERSNQVRARARYLSKSSIEVLALHGPVRLDLVFQASTDRPAEFVLITASALERIRKAICEQ